MSLTFNKANLIDGKVPTDELDVSAAIVVGLDAAISANTDVIAATTHLSNTLNPHSVTKAQVGLGNVPNTDCTNASNITSGTLPNAVLPPLVITTVQSAVNEVAQLALTTQEGDVVVRSDESKSYIRNAGITGTMTDFNELLSPTSAVISVNGSIGVVSLTTNDIPEYLNKRYVTDAQLAMIGSGGGLDILISDPVSPTNGDQWVIQNEIQTGQAMGTLGTTYAADVLLDDFRLSLKTAFGIKRIQYT